MKKGKNNCMFVILLLIIKQLNCDYGKYCLRITTEKKKPEKLLLLLCIIIDRRSEFFLTTIILLKSTHWIRYHFWHQKKIPFLPLLRLSSSVSSSLNFILFPRHSLLSSVSLLSLPSYFFLLSIISITTLLSFW